MEDLKPYFVCVCWQDSSPESSGEFSNSPSECVVNENNHSYGKDVNANKTNQSGDSLTGSLKVSFQNAVILNDKKLP